jgi:undecaprenyldiphospho-muramoylpentapeptide beta-N-acetylglucosaminyltransferase
MRLLVCAGMTGGGVYPALAVLQALENKTRSILWVGSRSGMEETLLSQYDLPYISISAAGIHGIDLKHLPKNGLQLINGLRESKAIIHEFKPDVIFYTGGYVGVPMSIAARKIPSVIFIPDIEPGLALKIIIRSANTIAVSTEMSRQYIPAIKNVQITGYPLRKEIKKWNRKASRKHFNIPMEARVLFVYGGSKGARSINQALIPVLDRLLSKMHVIHVTGEDNWQSIQTDKELQNAIQSPNYHLFPFLHEDMGAAFSAADLAVCRAGASTIGELPFFGLPAILIPYPHTWRYQHQNASFLAKNGGAEIIEDKNLAHELYEKVIEIITNKKKLKTMKNNMQKISVEDASQSIANLILEVGQAKQGDGGTK